MQGRHEGDASDTEETVQMERALSSDLERVASSMSNDDAPIRRTHARNTTHRPRTQHMQPMSKQTDPRSTGKRAKTREANKQRQQSIKRANEIKTAETYLERREVHMAHKRQAEKTKQKRGFSDKDKERTLERKKAAAKKPLRGVAPMARR